MSRWSRAVVFVMAFAVMPLQGIAATLSVLYCHGDTQAHAMHEPGSHDHAAHDDGHHDTHKADGSTGGTAAYHLCCNLTASAPPTVTLPATVGNFQVRAFVPDAFHDLFIPDRPQRPPLA